MRIDIVTLADGYFAIYVGGQLEYWGSDEPFPTLVETVACLQINDLRYHELGAYGSSATEYDDPPDRFEDIPQTWWTASINLGVES